MSTLRERVDRLREVFTGRVPAEIKAAMSDGAEDLCASDAVRLELENLPSMTESDTTAGVVGHF